SRPERGARPAQRGDAPSTSRTARSLGAARWWIVSELCHRAATPRRITWYAASGLVQPIASSHARSCALAGPDGHGAGALAVEELGRAVQCLPGHASRLS